MEIRRDGTWYYNGTPIERERLVWLFSTVLRREDDGQYYLVTPVEKCRIRVEDAPFQAILLGITGAGKSRVLTFTTNVAEQVVAGPEHPIRVEVDAGSGEPSPYIRVRDGLDALISRPVYYQLAELLQAEEVDGEEWLGVWSQGSFFRFVRSGDV